MYIVQIVLTVNNKRYHINLYKLIDPDIILSQ